MYKGCDIENNIDVGENPIEVAKERCSISQKVILIQIAHLNQMQSAPHSQKSQNK